MSQKVKFYLGDDTKSLQEHKNTEKNKSCLSDLIDNFFYVFNCF